MSFHCTDSTSNERIDDLISVTIFIPMTNVGECLVEPLIMTPFGRDNLLRNYTDCFLERERCPFSVLILGSWVPLCVCVCGGGGGGGCECHITHVCIYHSL